MLARDGYRWRETEQAPSETYLAATSSWDDYLQRRGAHFRHRLKPNCKRIERLGTVSYRWYRGPEKAESVFEEFLRMEEASWKAATGVRLSPQEREGFRALVRDRSGRLRADIVFLDVDGRPVSAMLSLLHRRCYYVFVTFFDERLRNLQPGRPLFREILRYAFESPEIDEVSFVGSYSSAPSWSLDIREYRNVRIYGRKLMGILAERMDRWKGRSGSDDPNEARDD